MNKLRRNLLKNAAGVSTVAVAVAAGVLKPTQVLASWNKDAFTATDLAGAMKGAGIVSPADSGDITIKAPDIAENGAVVPVEITSKIAGTSTIVLIAEKNVTPLVASFNLAGGAEPYVSTRIKMGKTALVRAVCVAGGKQFTAAKEVKVTIGGCGG